MPARNSGFVFCEEQYLHMHAATLIIVCCRSTNYVLAPNYVLQEEGLNFPTNTQKDMTGRAHLLKNLALDNIYPLQAPQHVLLRVGGGGVVVTQINNLKTYLICTGGLVGEPNLERRLCILF